MAIVDMCKISILALKEDRDDILTRLIKIGMVEITDEIDTPLKKEEAEALLSVDGNGELFELEGHLNDVQAVISSLEEYDTRKKGMLYFGQEITGDDFERISGKKEALKQVIDEILVYNSELSELRSKQNNAENTLNALKPWKDYELPLKVKGTKHTSIIKGTIPSNFSFEKVSEEVYKDNKFVRMERINQDKDEMYLVLLVLNENEDAAVNILKKYGFGKIHIKESDKNPKAQIKELKTAIAGFEKEREIIKEKIEKLSYNISELEIYYDYLLQEKEKSLIKKKMRSTASTVLIEGWTPIALIDKINDEIKTRFTCNIKTENPDKDEERPILLHNRGMAKATELITEMYSLPGHKETDPNLIMAPFYIVFFGIMLGDVGYGLILALLCGLLLWKANLKAGMKKVMSLLFSVE
jgi:V/A-type H+-transporting ATPase subunit I